MNKSYCRELTFLSLGLVMIIFILPNFFQVKSGTSYAINIFDHTSVQNSCSLLAKFSHHLTGQHHLIKHRDFALCMQQIDCKTRGAMCSGDKRAEQSQTPQLGCILKDFLGGKKKFCGLPSLSGPRSGGLRDGRVG